MRKLLFFLCLLPLSASAQKIISDQITESGSRIIVCEEKRGTNMVDKFKMFFSVGHISDGNDISIYNLSMHINSPMDIQIPEGGRLLVKLMDDSVITLTTDLAANSEKKYINIGGKLMDVLQTYVSYQISEEDAEKLSSGVKKVRVENNDANIIIEKDWKTDHVGKYLYKEFKLIQESLKSKKYSGSFEDNF